MTDSKYRAFVVAAETGSLTKTAEKLGYTQSGVSHLIGALEDELGFQLLLRNHTGAALTQEGELLLPYVRAFLQASDAVKEAADSVNGLSRGSIRVGTVSSIALQWLPKLFSVFSERYPNIHIEIFNATYSALEEALSASKLDCCFVTMPSRPEFSVTPLGKDRLMALLPENDPLADKSAITAADLIDQPFILPAEGSHYDIGKLFRSVHASPAVRFDMSDDYAAIEMVRQGMGITVLPELLVRDLPKNKIKALPISGTARQIGLAVITGRKPTPPTAAFLKLAEELFQ